MGTGSLPVISTSTQKWNKIFCLENLAWNKDQRLLDSALNAVWYFKLLEWQFKY